MIEARTEELTGTALDWAVAKARDEDVRVDADGDVIIVHKDSVLAGLREETHWRPTKEWGQGGPIVDSLLDSGDFEVAQTGHGIISFQNYTDEMLPIGNTAWSDPKIEGEGTGILSAACRTFILWRLGPTVQIPNSLGGWLTRPE